MLRQIRSSIRCIAANAGNYGGAALGALELVRACEAGAASGGSEGQQLRDAAEQRANALVEVPQGPPLPMCPGANG